MFQNDVIKQNFLSSAVDSQTGEQSFTGGNWNMRPNPDMWSQIVTFGRV